MEFLLPPHERQPTSSLIGVWFQVCLLSQTSQFNFVAEEGTIVMPQCVLHISSGTITYGPIVHGYSFLFVT